MQKMEKMTPEGLVVGFVEKPKPVKKAKDAEESEKPKKTKKETAE